MMIFSIFKYPLFAALFMIMICKDLHDTSLDSFQQLNDLNIIISIGNRLILNINLVNHFISSDLFWP